jgi:hypothetical protein
MPRAKPKDWEPKGIELLEEVEGLYSPEQLQSIVTIIGEFKGKRHALVVNRIMDVAGWLNMQLYYAQRPTSPEVKAALEPIAVKLRSLLNALTKLDSDSRKAITTIAGRSPPDLQAERCDWGPAFLGSTRFSRALKQLENLDTWIKTAVSEQKEGQKGRKPHDPAKEAAFRLLKVWQEFMPRPTIGPFTELLKETTRPVFKKHRLAPKLTSAARAVLHDNWRPADWDQD